MEKEKGTIKRGKRKERKKIGKEDKKEGIKVQKHQD